MCSKFLFVYLFIMPHIVAKLWLGNNINHLMYFKSYKTVLLKMDMAYYR
jgi:hypothetical protein